MHVMVSRLRLLERPLAKVAVPFALVILLTVGCGRGPAVPGSAPDGGGAASSQTRPSQAPSAAGAPGEPQAGYVIRSNPSGALIYVDGKLIGPAPVSYTGPTDGTHLVYASLGGYGLTGTHMALTGGGTTIDLVKVERATDLQQRTVAARQLEPAVTPLTADGVPAGSGSDSAPTSGSARAWGLPDGTGDGKISPDGRYLASTAYTEDGPARRGDLFTVDLLTGAVRRIATRTFERYPFTNDAGSFGYWLVGWRDATHVIILTQRTLADDPTNPALAVESIDVVSGDMTQLGDLGRYSQGLGYVKRAWLTGDGEGLFVHLPGRLLGIDLKTGQSLIDKALPSYDGMFMLTPSPSGWLVAYQVLAAQGKDRFGQIHLLDLRQGGADRVLSSDGEYAEGVHWSPDGTRLVYGVGFRRADGSYPIHPTEDWSPLVPDALAIVDLHPGWRDQPGDSIAPARLLKVAGSSLEVAGWSDPTTLILARVTVETGQSTEPGWRLHYEAILTADPATGTLGKAVPLPAGPANAMLVSGLAVDSGYLIAWDSSEGQQAARLQPDGTVLPLGTLVAGSEQPEVRNPWLIRRPSGEIVDTAGRVLAAVKGNYYYVADGPGWIVLRQFLQGGGSRLLLLQSGGQ